MQRATRWPASRTLAAYATAAAIALSITVSEHAKAQEPAVDTELLRQLQEVILQQQQQLNAQAQTIDALTSRVDQLEQETGEAQDLATQAQSTAAEAQTTASQAQIVAEQAVGEAQQVSEAVSEQVVTSGSDRIKLAISGHINRAVNIADDGDETKAYFVDNDVSNTRIRFVGTGQVSDDTTLGTRLEVAFSPNNSYDVSQDNESPDDFFDTRKAELFVRNDAYGQLLFGKGQAAADDTAEFDLSLVAGPIMYSGVADPVGGLQFRNDNGDLTGLTVGDAFFNFDGDRQDRVMYETPVFLTGLQVATSAGEDQRYDVALKWGFDYNDWTGVDIGPFTTLGAIAFQDPSEQDVDWRMSGSFSVLHNPTGLSVTVSGGGEANDEKDDPFNAYGKLAWDTSFFDFGRTGFGADFTYTENQSGEGDEGVSVGFAAIQLIEDYGAEIYAQGRWFNLDRGGNAESVDDIIVGTVGTRVKF